MGGLYLERIWTGRNRRVAVSEARRKISDIGWGRKVSSMAAGRPRDILCVSDQKPDGCLRRILRQHASSKSPSATVFTLRGWFAIRAHRGWRAVHPSRRASMSRITLSSAVLVLALSFSGVDALPAHHGLAGYNQEKSV